MTVISEFLDALNLAMGESHLSLWFALFILSAFAGMIKGMTGFGFPMIMFSGMSLFFDPTKTVAYLTLPLLVVNILQAFQYGARAAIAEAKASVALTLTLCICIFLAAPLVTILPSESLFFILGPTITFVALIQLAGWKFKLPKHLHQKSAVATGVAAGLSGGFAGVWAPLIVLYLVALNIEKRRQILIQGVAYSFGSIALIAAHTQSGIIHSLTLSVSAILVIPSLLGLMIGAKILGRINQPTFIKVTLIVLVIAGLNLVGRAIL